jgi:hypothetical protein
MSGGLKPHKLYDDDDDDNDDDDNDNDDDDDILRVCVCVSSNSYTARNAQAPYYYLWPLRGLPYFSLLFHFLEKFIALEILD